MAICTGVLAIAFLLLFSGGVRVVFSLDFALIPEERDDTGDKVPNKGTVVATILFRVVLRPNLVSREPDLEDEEH